MAENELPRLKRLTVGETLVSAAVRFPNRLALVFGERRATWRELRTAAVDSARCLIGLGVEKDDHVGILMPNCFDYVVLYLATQLIGARAVLLNARYRSDDLQYVLPKAQVRYLFVGGQAAEHCDYRPMLEAAFPSLLRQSVIAGEGFSHPALPALSQIVEIGETRPGPWLSEAHFRKLGGPVAESEVWHRAEQVCPDDVGLMIFSSGTTSRPKACMLSHRSLCVTGANMGERFRLAADDVVWDPLPLFHMSTILPMAGCRATGACFIGMEHFEADAAMALLIEERPTVHYAGFPAIVGALVDHPDFGGYDQSRLRINHVVGPVDLLRRFARTFPAAVPVNSYGLTEATGVPCYSELDDPPDLLFRTSGRVFEGMEARILGQDGEPVADGEAGEICLRGNAIFVGYFDDEEATRNAVDTEGWLHTGDLGRIGEGGRLIYEGRLKDMLKIGGENVAAVELESFLMTHPGVRMAQVVGVPDDRLLEVAAAFIERAPGVDLTEEEVIEHCVGRIASYKIPRYVRFVEQWPMSATKVQKFELIRSFEPYSKIDVRRSSL